MSGVVHAAMLEHRAMRSNFERIVASFLKERVTG
jgi:hypothetical protein